MKKQKNFQLAVIGVLAFAVLFMSIGFAAYSQVLNIKGMATVGSNKWSIHFNPSSYQLGEGSVKESSKAITDDSIAYSVKLEKPGDFYLFQIDVINDGQINAILDSIKMTELSAEEEEYVNYTVSFEGQEFSSSRSGLKIALPAATGVNRKVVMVRVAYELPDDHKVLPLEDPLELNLAASFGYSQSK